MRAPAQYMTCMLGIGGEEHDVIHMQPLNLPESRKGVEQQVQTPQQGILVVEWCHAVPFQVGQV